MVARLVFFIVFKIIIIRLGKTNNFTQKESFMEIVSLIISLISGAVGGNIAGAATTDKNLGPIFNTIAGLIGGGAGEFILKALGILAATQAPGAAGVSEMDLTSLLATIGVSGVSGGVLTAIVTLIKDAIQKK